MSGRLVGQFLLEKFAKRSVLSLQVKHQHLQLDALLPQILSNHSRDVSDISASESRLRNAGVNFYLLVEQSLDNVIGHLTTGERVM